jgi:hypothetical protein
MACRGGDHFPSAAKDRLARERDRGTDGSTSESGAASWKAPPINVSKTMTEQSVTTFQSGIVTDLPSQTGLQNPEGDSALNDATTDFP